MMFSPGVCEYQCATGFEPGTISGAASATDNSVVATNSNGNGTETTLFLSPSHIATCADGAWTFTDAGGTTHGCVEKGCPPLTNEDVAFALLDTCGEAMPAGGSCTIDCTSGNNLVGNGVVNCVGGQWIPENGTACVASPTFGDTFNCKGLTASQIEHVEVSSCRGTPGRQNVGYTAEFTNVLIWARDFVAATSVDGRDRRVPCEYTCAEGYFPNAKQTQVYCDLGSWVLGSASCLALTCDDLWTNWTECSGFCDDGAHPGEETRTFPHPQASPPDVMAAIAESTDGDGSCPMFSYEYDPATGYATSPVVEQRACASRPRCCSSSDADADASSEVCTAGFQALSCDMFWTEYSDCTNFCVGGNQTRVFSHATAVEVANEVEDAQTRLELLALLGETSNDVADIVREYIEMECGQDFGAEDVRDCPDGVDGHPMCAVVASVIPLLLILVAILVVLVWLCQRQRKVSWDLEHTRLGQVCVQVAKKDPVRAAFLLGAVDTLRRQFRDLDMRSIWFALRGGKRSVRKAAKLLDSAHALQANDPTSLTSLVEALEHAEWLLEKSKLPPLHQQLLQQVPNRQRFMQVLRQCNFATPSTKHRGRGSLFYDDFNAPFLHYAVSTRWADYETQRWVVCQLIPHVFLGQLYKSRPSRNVEGISAFHLALRRRCHPSVIQAVLDALPNQAESVSGNALAELSEFYQDESKNEVSICAAVATTSLRIRLAARIENEAWDMDRHATINGVTGFVPPCVKARELKMLLSEQAESMLLYVTVPQARLGSVCNEICLPCPMPI